MGQENNDGCLFEIGAFATPIDSRQNGKGLVARRIRVVGNHFAVGSSNIRIHKINAKSSIPNQNLIALFVKRGTTPGLLRQSDFVGKTMTQIQ